MVLATVVVFTTIAMNQTNEDVVSVVSNEIEIAGTEAGNCPGDSWAYKTWDPPGLFGGGQRFYDCCQIIQKGEPLESCS